MFSYTEMTIDNILSIRNLNVQYCLNEREFPILKNVNFDIPKGKILGITGPSGSGKSMTALSLMGLVSFFNHLEIKGEIIYQNANLLENTPIAWRKLRGKTIALIIQQPEAALNPVKKVGDQILECFMLHQYKKNSADFKESVLELLHEVGLAEVDRIYHSYPHELSGGQLQRIVIAMAIVHRPDIIIADEATSSLDSKIAIEIMELLLKLQKKFQSTLVFISHDMGMLKEIADHILLLKNGEVADFFSKEDFQLRRLSSDTMSYLNAGSFENRAAYITTKDVQKCLEIHDLNKIYYQPSWLFWKKGKAKEVLSSIHLTLETGKMLGVLGESGSGKTTLAKIIAGIIPSSTGSILFQGLNIAQNSFRKNPLLRRKIQMVLQDALTSMNPKMKIAAQWEEVINYYSLAINKEEITSKMNDLLNEFSLPHDILDKYPIQLSGGQRQRAALARTLLLQPDLIIFDESLSALDVFNQQRMINLIINLQSRRHFTGIFISHDVKLIKALCHEVIVLDNGRIVKSGATCDVLV